MQIKSTYKNEILSVNNQISDYSLSQNGREDYNSVGLWDTGVTAVMQKSDVIRSKKRE